MTDLIKLSLCAAALSAFAVPALAQGSATQSTTGSARVIQPITLTKNADLAFGSVVKPSTGSNTIGIDAASGARAVTGGGNAALAPSSSGRAAYAVSGEGGQTFSISTPAAFDMTRQGGTETISVTVTPSAASGTISGALGNTGTAAFGVGGSFDVAPSPVRGAYTGTFDATVAYN